MSRRSDPASRPRAYRTRRPSRLAPNIRLSPDTARCPALVCQPYDLRAPDYDPVRDGPPVVPMALAICTHQGWCRYQAVLSPNPWHTFGPPVVCAGYAPFFPHDDSNVVDVRPLARCWWPETPPSTPRETPATAEELVAFAAKLVIGAATRERSCTNPNGARDEARRAVKAWREHHLSIAAPRIDVRAGRIRIWQPDAETYRELPAVEMPVEAFIAGYLTPPAQQLVLAL